MPITQINIKRRVRMARQFLVAIGTLALLAVSATPDASASGCGLRGRCGGGYGGGCYSGGCYDGGYGVGNGCGYSVQYQTAYREEERTVYKMVPTTETRTITETVL